MYELKETREEGTSKKRIVRIYTNNSGTEVKTYKIYTDEGGRDWWGFWDLHQIPYLRTAYAKHIIDLYSLGLSKSDLIDWCVEEKRILKSDDPEKYEKLYSMILEKEKIFAVTSDPIRQHLALCTVYILAEDERIDYFDDAQAELKMKLWGGFPGSVAFFLNWHQKRMANYLDRLGKASRTVSALQKAFPPQQPGNF